jgi:tetratricopeptide (TPR) repeat protein
MRQLVVVTGTLGLLVAGVTEATAQYQPPQCELNTGHFLVNGAVVYLKGAAEESDSQKGQRMLSDAQRNLVEAIGRGEEENPAVWYFLGRYFKEVGDAAGADTAFARAGQLAPECAEDIAYHRESMWVPIVNRGIDSLRSGNFEAAKQIFTDAARLWRGDPIAAYYLGRIYGNEGEADSAIAYFKDVLEMGSSDTARAEQIKDAHYNIGLLYSMLAQRDGAARLWDSSTTWLRSYLDESPEDSEAVMALARAYEQSGDSVRALAMYDTVLAKAADMDAASLFEIGTKFFRAQNFQAAARAYAAGLEKNPYSRDALFNLANTYLVLEDAPKMLDAARRLDQLDARNAETGRLISAAHQLAGRGDSTLAWLQRTRAMQWEVLVEFSEPLQNAYGVSGRIRNSSNRPVEVPAVTFEFLDREGNVVATDSIPSQSVPANEEAGFELTATEEGIVGWRYRVR